MTDSNQKYRTIQRNNLWYDQYDHSVRLRLPEASALRWLDHDKIDRVVEIRRQWGQRMSKSSPGGSWRGIWEKVEITEIMRANLHSMTDWLLAWPQPYRANITGDWMYLYSLGPGMMESLCQQPWIDPAKVLGSRVELIGPKDHVLLQRPGHAYRTWFRNRGLDPEMLVRLRTMLEGLPGVRCSPALARRLRSHHGWLLDYYFIDHDDPWVLTMLALVLPGATRKTLPITQHK